MTESASSHVAGDSVVDQKPSKVSKFEADGVLFDMDGTLTDSIAAVEAAWTAKALELGLSPKEVIEATHGRRAADNLQELIPELEKHHIDKEVEKFERSILAFADTPSGSQPRRDDASRSQKRDSSSTISTNGPITPNSSVLIEQEVIVEESPFVEEDGNVQEVLEKYEDADMSVRILPGVRDMIDSLPTDKYAVATSGAQTYCHGCLTRTEITIPEVCVTADDPRLLRGKPHPDPFLLAAKDLGVNPEKAVIFEDSPSGIKAAVAAGSTVIAVCTSHSRDKIEGLGAHYVVDDMEQVKVAEKPNGRLEFEVQHD